MGYPWATHGQPTGHHSKFMGYPWANHALPARCPPDAHRMPMGCSWDATTNGPPMGWPLGAHRVAHETPKGYSRHWLLMECPQANHELSTRCPRGAQNMSMGYPWGTYICASHGVPTRFLWNAHRIPVGYACATYGCPQARATHGHGMTTDHVWSTRGLRMGYPRSAYKLLMLPTGCPMGCTQATYGMPTGCSWAAHGQSQEAHGLRTHGLRLGHPRTLNELTTGWPRDGHGMAMGCL